MVIGVIVAMEQVLSTAGCVCVSTRPLRGAQTEAFSSFLVLTSLPSFSSYSSSSSFFREAEG